MLAYNCRVPGFQGDAADGKSTSDGTAAAAIAEAEWLIANRIRAFSEFCNFGYSGEVVNRFIGN